MKKEPETLEEAIANLDAAWNNFTTEIRKTKLYAALFGLCEWLNKKLGL